jgi:putative transposase
MPRATFYARLSPKEPVAPTARFSPRALVPDEQQAVLDLLHEERFVDMAPAAVVAKLLEEGTYLCSVRTMYRILAAHGEIRERRAQRKHPVYSKPELLATGPNQVWSWDITKLRGPVKWRHYHLYVIIDIFSRYVVGWMIAERETAELAEHLIGETMAKENIVPEQLALHADRGVAMTSKGVALLLADLGVTKSHSRPYTSDDNPYSEAQFKTLKYRPDFPAAFGGIEDARTHCRAFFNWYNHDHQHSGIGYFTPAQVHLGLAEKVQATRRQTLKSAYVAHPERFVRGLPTPPTLPAQAWINPPVQPTPERAAEPPEPTKAEAAEAAPHLEPALSR